MSDYGAERIMLLCSNDPAVLGSGEALMSVGYTPVTCASLKDVQRELSDSVVAAVLDAELPKDQTFGIYRFMRKEGKIPFLVLLPPPVADQPSWVMELEHGEHEDFARKPISFAELVLRLNALLIHSGAYVPSDTGMTLSANTQTTAAMAGFGKIICVFGAHGGVGKTTLAVHLAVGLRKLTDSRVALVDGDLWMGDSLVYLNLTATRSILNATVNGIPNDPEVWTHFLIDHASGVKVLAAPAHMEDVERVPDGAVAAAALALRRYFDYVVVDLDDTPTESTLGVLEKADQVLVVLTPELGSVRNTLRLLTAGSQIGLNPRMRLVLNRSNSGLELSQIESVIPRPIVAMVPSDGRLFVAAANLGVTIFEVDTSGRTAARKAIEQLVRDVSAYGKPKATKSSKSGVFAGLGGLLPKRQ